MTKSFLDIITFKQMIREMSSPETKIVSLGTKAMLTSRDDNQSKAVVKDDLKGREVVQYPLKPSEIKPSGAPAYRSS